MKKIVFLMIFLLFIVGCGKKTKNIEKESKVLVSIAKYDFKYGATYDGLAIMEDGTIYTMYYSSTKSDYNNYIGSYSIYTRGGFTSFVKDKWKTQDEKVSNRDLRKIKNMIHKLNKKDTDCKDRDSRYSNLTIYKEDDAISFSTSGSCDVSSSDKNVKELLSMINEYKK